MIVIISENDTIMSQKRYLLECENLSINLNYYVFFNIKTRLRNWEIDLNNFYGKEFRNN